MAQKTVQRKGAWRHSRRVAWRKVADEAVILDVETAVYFSLSGPGLRMWELIGAGHGAESVARIMAGEYDAGEDQLRADCAALAAQLAKEGLLESA